MKNRVQKIFNKIDEELDAIIIKNSSETFTDSNFFYVTNLKKGLFENSVAFLFPDGKITLIIPSLEEESAKTIKDSEVFVYNKIDEYNKNLRDLLKNVKNIGINFNNISYKEINNLKDLNPKSSFFDIEKPLNLVRQIKDKKELSYIKKAAVIVDKVVEKIPEFISKDIYEYELAAEINYLMSKYGADKPSFETISSFGIKTAEPHYTHGNKKISEGDFVLCDFGANYMKYNSDITRTFVFKKASEKQKKIYETVKKAQQIGLKKIKPSIKASDVHNAVFDYIQKSPFKGCFIHSTGHSLGLDVHDPGFSINSICETLIEENMVFTVEPGIYIPGFGGVRIEDDIVVTNDGFKFLTKSFKEFLEI